MDQEEKNKKRKFILMGLGVAAMGALSYFGWEYYLKGKRKKEGDLILEDPEASKAIIPQSSTFAPAFFTQPKTRNDEFPLKKLSKGPRVKMLQDALIAKNGKAILPNRGADGDFGPELAAALKKLNLPDTIDESTYNVIVQVLTVNASMLAKSLYKDAVGKNLKGIIASLQKMKSKNDYNSVSNEFKKYPLRGVRQTLVNGILESFSDENQKEQIRLEFSRIGLKYDGKKWSLSGLDGFKVITTQATTVWRTAREGAKVPAKMILGTEISSRDGFTLFENNGKNFIIETKTIKYL